jgi:hypothetical protein
VATNGAILALAGDKQNLGRAVKAIEDMVAASFETHKMRAMTYAEVKRRFDMCVKIFAILRGDLKWSLEKAFDMMPNYLGCELDGAEWLPSARTMWRPQTDTSSLVRG